MSDRSGARPPPARREIAQDLFRDHLDLTRLSRAMALARAEREAATGAAPDAPRAPGAPDAPGAQEGQGPGPASRRAARGGPAGRAGT